MSRVRRRGREHTGLQTLRRLLGPCDQWAPPSFPTALRFSAHCSMLTKKVLFINLGLAILFECCNFKTMLCPLEEMYSQLMQSAACQLTEIPSGKREQGRDLLILQESVLGKKRQVNYPVASVLLV